MKKVLKSTAAVIAITAMFASPASAMISKGELSRNVLSAVGAGSNINVHVTNGVVTLTGYFADTGEKNAAVRAAAKAEGVTDVINLATQSN